MDKGAGCNGPRKILATALREVGEEPQGNPVQMLNDDRFGFIVLVESPQTQKLWSARSAMLMSRWTVQLLKSLAGSKTSRPSYQLNFKSEIDQFNEEQSEYTLPLSRIRSIRRGSLDGKASVILELLSGNRIFVVPYDKSIIAKIRVGLPQTSRKDLSLQGVKLSDTRVCCCSISSLPLMRDKPTLVRKSCGMFQTPCPLSCSARKDLRLQVADDLGAHLAKAMALARGPSAEVPSEPADGDKNPTRLIYEALVHTDFSCHAEGQLKDIIRDGWNGGVGATLGTHKAKPHGSGAGGVSGLVRDVFGRHRFMSIGSGESCVNLVREGAPESQLHQAGCEPYVAKAAVTALVQECLDVASSVEFANLRAWGVMAQAYLNNSRILTALEGAGYSPAESWRKLLVDDVKRIENFRVATLSQNIKADADGVWHILQRASTYAQRDFDNEDAYLKQIDRKLDDIDNLFWEQMRKPSDLHTYPHMYNEKDPRDIVGTKAYQDMVRDDETFQVRIQPILNKMSGATTPQQVSQAVGECVRSGECAESPLLFELMQKLDDTDFWKIVPVGWLASLSHTPHMYPTPPSSSSLVFPRSTRVAFKQCFIEPQTAIESERELMNQIETQVKKKTWLSRLKNEILHPPGWPQAPSLKNDDILSRLEEALDNAKGLDLSVVTSSSVQGALACYPTLFGSLGMEMEIRDETGYSAGGRRPKDMEQVLGECSVAPQCARLAIERLLHFNTKHWDQYAAITSTLTWSSDDAVCKPDSGQNGNCQLFAHCFQHEVRAICKEIPGCCSQKQSSNVCVATGSFASASFGDFLTVMGWGGETNASAMQSNPFWNQKGGLLAENTAPQGDQQ
eukprot:TRINITY_DN5668_c0_g1_i1.p1 TRINITY_DN5668_c0_g1~~TRINITY_DN5668_c0_g1_i1.p1  ORF type:complete len:947 (+),score=83.59 TRINITY_DN5668_c0_g1_i1:296-2842(+)